jgi:D-arabinose 1-dehydrogenase-like Zn-dependent alcohol dehydrogenase
VRLAKAVTGVAPYVADIDPRKKDAALAAGAREFIDASQADAGRNFVKATGGAAAAIDYVGGEASAQLGFNAIRKSGKLVVVGLFGGTFTTPVPMFVMRAVTVQGSYVGSLAEFKALRDLVVGGALPPMPIATRPLAEAGRTVEDLKAGKIVGRVVLQP